MELTAAVKRVLESMPPKSATIEPIVNAALVAGVKIEKESLIPVMARFAQRKDNAQAAAEAIVKMLALADDAASELAKRINEEAAKMEALTEKSDSGSEAAKATASGPGGRADVSASARARRKLEAKQKASATLVPGAGGRAVPTPDMQSDVEGVVGRSSTPGTTSASGSGSDDDSEVDGGPTSGSDDDARPRHRSKAKQRTNKKAGKGMNIGDMYEDAHGRKMYVDFNRSVRPVTWDNVKEDTPEAARARGEF